MSVGLAPGSGPSTSAAEAAGESFIHTRAFEVLSRAGFVARGLVWGIIGILALKLALGQGGKVTNQQGALHTVAHQTFGSVLLVLVAIGLGGYSLWRLLRAGLGHGPEGSDSAMDRVAAAASGIAYAIMCTLAIEVLIGSDSPTSSNAKHQTAGVLGWPAGTWIVGIAGVAMFGTGLYQGYRGISRKFVEDAKIGEMGPVMRKWYPRIGTTGLLARMVVFGLIGIFLVKAAIDYNAQAAVGLDGALAKLLHREFGPWILGLVAAGLVSFALYSLSDARYRKI